MLDFILHNKTLHIILISILSGSLIGLEREYKNKSTGFRTVVLICLSSTIFTLVSQLSSSDRIAANIVTGIGFLGAGVIFQGRFAVEGLTTATVIWTTAAIGMMIGYGELALGFIFALIAVFILSLFEQVEALIANLFARSTIHVTFIDSDKIHLSSFYTFLHEKQVRVYQKKIIKDENKISVVYEISGRRKDIHQLDEEAVQLDYVYIYNNP
jgi:putative Mg2+ transporter-C (MgtC) family protein